MQEEGEVGDLRRQRRLLRLLGKRNSRLRDVYGRLTLVSCDNRKDLEKGVGLRVQVDLAMDQEWDKEQRIRV